MGDLSTLLLLVLLLGVAGLWLTLSRSRERAMGIARAQCRQHGLQLLDETVGLSGARLCRISGRLVLERRYGFEVSIDGDDRESGRLWMVGDALTGVSLPTIHLTTPTESPILESSSQRPPSHDNVLSFPREPRGRNTLH
jgi:hypothetical protein